MYTLVIGIIKYIPVENLGTIPFLPLAEFTTHEQQFLSRVAEHVGIQGPQVGKTLPLVTGHLVEH